MCRDFTVYLYSYYYKIHQLHQYFMDILGDLSGVVKVWKIDDNTSSSYRPSPRHLSRIMTCTAIPGTNDTMTVTQIEIWRWDGSTGHVKAKYSIHPDIGLIQSLAMCPSSLVNGMPPQVCLRRHSRETSILFPLRELQEGDGGVVGSATENDFGDQGQICDRDIVALSPNGRYVLAVGYEKNCHVVDLKKPKADDILFSIPFLSMSFPPFFSPDSTKVSASVNYDGNLGLATWNMDGSKIAEVTGNDETFTGKLEAATYVPKTSFVALLLDNEFLQLRNSNDLQLIQEVCPKASHFKHTHMLLVDCGAIAVTNDGSYIVTSTSDTWVRVWDTLTLEEVGRYHVGVDVISMAVVTSPNGLTYIHCADTMNRNSVLEIKL